ncbi:MAG: ChaN family lipoprotein [Pararhodobacter sp.]|nr:ChaN family lipoprotein [Pararhodobacter sp.]
MPELHPPFAPLRGLALALSLSVAAIGAAKGDPIATAALAAMSEADIVILGEVHDNPEHHRNQARAVAAIAPAALVWEMLTPGQAARMPDVRDDAQAVAEALDWDATGWPDFSLYHPIVLAAPGAQTYGAGVPRERARRVFEEPASEVFADLFGVDAGPLGLDTPLAPADQAAREAEQATAHCDALPGHLLPGMVAAQRLRDAALAHVALTAFAETGGPVVVIAGTGHARNDIGIPAFLRQAEGDLRVVTLGQMEAEPDADAPFDFWIVTEPVSRPDPCAAFR